MRHGRVAQRYAEALLGAAAEAGVEEAVSQDLAMVQRAIAGSTDLQLLLKSPVIKQDRKREALKAIFEGRVSATTLVFLDLVTEKGRESALPFIIKRFGELRDVTLGILRMRVTSGTDLSDDQKKALTERFAALTQKTIDMTVDTDPALKGGFLARVGDTVFDGTIKRQLEMMRLRLREGEGTN